MRRKNESICLSHQICRPSVCLSDDFDLRNPQTVVNTCLRHLLFVLFHQRRLTCGSLFSPRRSHFCTSVSFRQSLRRGRCAWSAGPKMCEALSSLWQHQHYWWRRRRCQNKRSLWHCWHHTYSQATTTDLTWSPKTSSLFTPLSKSQVGTLINCQIFFQVVLKIVL